MQILEMKNIFNIKGVTVYLDETIPPYFEIGDGNLLYVSGCYCVQNETVEKLFLRVNNKDLIFSGFSYLRTEHDSAPALLTVTQFDTLKKGFWFFVPLNTDNVKSLDFSLVFHLKISGVVTVHLGKADFVRFFQRSKEHSDYSVKSLMMHEDPDNPFIVIALATYNPKTLSIKRQIESIKNQTYHRWICLIHDDHSSEESIGIILDLIQDDPRFLFHSHDRNLGFYKNFESLLLSVPNSASFVALSDQDDYWYPDKLMKMITAFDTETVLVYSDMRIVDSNGSVKYDSFWYQKTRGDTLIMQLLNNSITGASCMFRKVLCEKILPFPPDIGSNFHMSCVAFHDHWIGCIAMMAGKIAFINEPLYDYYQHNDNVAGYSSSLSWYQKTKKIAFQIRESGVLLLLILYYKKYLTHGYQRLCMAFILEMRFNGPEYKLKGEMSEFVKVLTSGLSILQFLIKNLHRGGLTGGTDKMLFIGNFCGIIFPLVLSIYKYKYQFKMFLSKINKQINYEN